jgi:ribosome-associated protein
VTEPTPALLRLDDFLKLSGVVGSGGHAKVLIQGGDVKLNGVPETRRRKQLSPGDVVEVDGRRFTVEAPQ